VLEVITQGILTGFILTLSFGAGFFALIQTSINRGIYKGLLVALGALLSDVMYILICIFATSFVSSELQKYEKTIRLVGFAALAIMGVYTYLKHQKTESKVDSSTPTKGIFYVLKGIMLNKVNPLIIVTWLGIVAYIESSLQFSNNDILIYFTCVVGAMMINQFLICYSAVKIKKILSDTVITRLNHVVGIIFMIVAVLLVWPVVAGWMGH
jgi:threonine/homoserine/homoserine lactone efflux protein